ncbi:hypothetical protein QAD02_015417 [Eretmocerus hayati]|uniref:Uncharacterized protein n=1 Tax=Eretmocerus hayati TaxID=131215 RepID=A0ACC2P7Q8_9HYME|nr:hypothetical protein QAD02_015417 [Eretmocerus hayati]
MKSDILNKYHSYGLRVFGACSESFRLPGFYCVIGLMSFFLVFAVCDCIAVSDDLDTLINDLITTLGILSTICNSLAFYSNRRKLELLIDEMYDDLVSKYASDLSYAIMLTNTKTSRLLSNFILAMYSVMNMSFLLKAITSYLIGEVDERIFVCPSAFPWNGRKSPIYEITITCQFVMSSAVFYNLAIIEGQLAFLVLHACSKVMIVKGEIAKLSQHADMNSVDQESLYAIIKKISQEHLGFLKFVKNLEDVYSMVSLVHILGLTLLLVVTGFTLIVATEKKAPMEAINYSVYLLSFLLNSGLYCYAGQHLNNQSETIATEISNCPWYKFHVIHKKNINFMLMRAQIPVVLTAGKFNQLSFVLLTSMIKTSYSYLSIVRASR